MRTHGVLPFLTGFTIPLCVLRMSVCVSLLPPAWLPTQWASLMSDQSSESVQYHSYGAQFLCWHLSFGEDGKSPTY